MGCLAVELPQPRNAGNIVRIKHSVNEFRSALTPLPCRWILCFAIPTPTPSEK